MICGWYGVTTWSWGHRTINGVVVQLRDGRGGRPGHRQDNGLGLWSCCDSGSTQRLMARLVEGWGAYTVLSHSVLYELGEAVAGGHSIVMARLADNSPFVTMIAHRIIVVDLANGTGTHFWL